MALKYTKPPGYPPIISEASSKNSGSNFSPTTASNYGISQEVEIHGEPNVSITDCVIPIKQDQVRWFYRDRDKYWQPFCGSDSLRLEQSFSMNQCITGNDKVFIPVMGDMYEVNLYKKTLMPIYWDLYGKQTFVMRSWWFEVINDNWYPFEERNLTILERTHKSVLEAEKCGNISTKDPKSPQFKVQIDDSEVIWQCSTDVRRCKLDIASRILGFKGNQVKRGYKILATLTDTLPPIGHIVFVLHGVGQAMEGASIIKCTDSVRELSKSLIDKYFPSKSMSSRVEFFPVNWRTLLLLDNGFVSKITLSDAKGFRNILNLSVGDVMYYTSAKFGPEILDSLLMQLNNLYGKFIERNPEFQSRGKVSILAHSLGSVVMYDALYSCIPRADHLQAMGKFGIIGYYLSYNMTRIS